VRKTVWPRRGSRGVANGAPLTALELSGDVPGVQEKQSFPIKRFTLSFSFVEPRRRSAVV
jgi:hypothetical protein